MVERLKAAIDKARAQRASPDAEGARADLPASPAAATAGALRPSRDAAPVAWARLPALAPDVQGLERHRIVAATRQEPGSGAFDLMRTRLLKLCRDAGWRRIGIASPTKGCGKSTISLNLGFSLARNPSTRALVLDLDMRAPHIAELLSAKEPNRQIGQFLRGEATMEDVFVRIGENLAVGLSSEPERNSAELLNSPSATAAIAQAIDVLKPDIALFDMPPILVNDDAVALAPSLDGVLLVASADATTSAELTECERLLNGVVQVIGVALNKCRFEMGEGYGYEYEKS